MSFRVIDDRDQSLMYIGLWSQGGAEPEHGSTTTSTAIAGSMAILNFSGKRKSELLLVVSGILKTVCRYL